GEGDIASLRVGGEIPAETAVRGHDFDDVPGLELAVRPGREHAAGHELDRDFQRAFGGRHAKRISGPHFFAVEVARECKVLAGAESEGFTQLGGRLETNGDAVRRFTLYLGNAELVEVDAHFLPPFTGEVSDAQRPTKGDSAAPNVSRF